MGGKRSVDATSQFATNLRRLRTRRDLSQEALADLAGLHRTEVSQLERARREPRIGTMLALAAALEVSINDLTDGITLRVPQVSRAGRFEVSQARTNAIVALLHSSVGAGAACSATQRLLEAVLQDIDGENTRLAAS